MPSHSLLLCDRRRNLEIHSPNQIKHSLTAGSVVESVFCQSALKLEDPIAAFIEESKNTQKVIHKRSRKTKNRKHKETERNTDTNNDTMNKVYIR